MKKQVEKTAATRQAFIDAFCILGKERPIERITIKELTDKAGYNRSTFYQYFKDLYGLLKSIEDDIILHFKENIKAKFEHGNLEEEFIFTFKKIHEEKAKYFDILLGNSNSIRFAERLKMEMTPVLMEMFHLPKGDVKVTYILEFYLSGAISTISSWINNQRDISSAELATLLRDMVTKGLLPQLNKYSLKPSGTPSD